MIDVEHLCPGCMGRWEDTKKPCPRCGFSGYEEALPPLRLFLGDGKPQSQGAAALYDSGGKIPVGNADRRGRLWHYLSGA